MLANTSVWAEYRRHLAKTRTVIYTSGIIGMRTQSWRMSISRAMQQTLLYPVEELVEKASLISPDGLVYSTGPISGRCRNGHKYVVKGLLDKEVVKAEAAAHILATSFAIPTPRWAYISAPYIADHLLFGSEMVVEGFRDVAPWLRKKKVLNQDCLSRIAAFDVWISNPDRNLGNLIGRSSIDPRDSRLEILAIDFEKALTLNGDTPAITSSSKFPKSLMPRGELATLLGKLERPSQSWMTRFANIQELDLANALRPIQQQLKLGSKWHETTGQLLKKRASKMPEMIEEAWQ